MRCQGRTESEDSLHKYDLMTREYPGEYLTLTAGHTPPSLCPTPPVTRSLVTWSTRGWSPWRGGGGRRLTRCITASTSGSAWSSSSSQSLSMFLTFCGNLARVGGLRGWCRESSPRSLMRRSRGSSKLPSRSIFITTREGMLCTASSLLSVNSWTS